MNEVDGASASLVGAAGTPAVDAGAPPRREPPGAGLPPALRPRRAGCRPAAEDAVDDDGVMGAAAAGMPVPTAAGAVLVCAGAWRGSPVWPPRRWPAPSRSRGGLGAPSACCLRPERPERAWPSPASRSRSSREGRTMTSGMGIHFSFFPRVVSPRTASPSCAGRRGDVGAFSFSVLTCSYIRPKGIEGGVCEDTRGAHGGSRGLSVMGGKRGHTRDAFTRPRGEIRANLGPGLA